MAFVENVTTRAILLQCPREGQLQHFIVSLLGKLHLLYVFVAQSRRSWVVAIACFTIANEPENIVQSRLTFLLLLLYEMRSENEIMSEEF